MTDSRIIEMCESASSMSEAARELGISLSILSKRAKKLNCYKTNQSWNKGKSVLDDTEKSSIIFCENSSFNIVKNRRKSILNYFGNCCSNCKIIDWLDLPLSLEIDHINGINTDNRIENLRTLCPNCHSQTDTFRGRNIKSIKKNDDGFFRYTKDELIKSIQESFSIREVCLKLGITPKGGNYKTIRSKIEEYSIELNKSLVRYKFCKCGIGINNRSKHCKLCSSKKQRKCERPKYESLLNGVEKLGYSAIGRMYNVSDNTIRKWIKSYECENITI